MLEPSDRAQRYRLRAEELRTICADWHDGNAIETLTRMAMQYESWADNLDEQKAKAAGEAARAQNPHGLPL